MKYSSVVIGEYTYETEEYTLNSSINHKIPRNVTPTNICPYIQSSVSVQRNIVQLYYSVPRKIKNQGM
jgi:hypothetical protein